MTVDQFNCVYPFVYICFVIFFFFVLTCFAQPFTFKFLHSTLFTAQYFCIYFYIALHANKTPRNTQLLLQQSIFSSICNACHLKIAKTEEKYLSVTP